MGAGMRGTSRVVVVVPAWNEAPRIARVVEGMPAWVDHVVVVDDASRDGTAEIALAAGDRRVVVERHERNRGVGAAIVTGYRRAARLAPSDGDVFAVMAGDGQMDPTDLAAVVAPVVEGCADYVKGNRFAWRAGAHRMPTARRVGGAVFSWATAKAIGVRLSDSQCGYTAVSGAACARLDLAGLWTGYGYPNDLLSQLTLRGLRIAEAPVRPVYADEVSRLRLRHLPVIAAIVGRSLVRRLRASALPRSRLSRSTAVAQRSVEDGANVGEGMIEVE